MVFGQLVVGPPGSGKSTYCKAAKTFLESLGRKVAVVNLDPANEFCECDVDVRSLVSVDEVMERLKLGPNGAMLFSMQFLESNIEWLETSLKQYEGHYFLFDLPGQVELFTNHHSVRNIILAMQKFPLQLCAVNLVDSHHCSDAAKFVSVLLMSLSCMLHLELPHVNVLSKIDIIQSMGPVAFHLDFYTEVLDLEYLVSMLKETVSPKYAALSAALCGLVDDFGLVKFFPICVNDADTMAALQASIDKANGYIYGGRGAVDASTVPSQDELLELLEQRYLGNDNGEEDMEEDSEGGEGGEEGEGRAEDDE